MHLVTALVQMVTRKQPITIIQPQPPSGGEARRPFLGVAMAMMMSLFLSQVSLQDWCQLIGKEWMECYLSHDISRSLGATWICLCQQSKADMEAHTFISKGGCHTPSGMPSLSFPVTDCGMSILPGKVSITAVCLSRKVDSICWTSFKTPTVSEVFSCREPAPCRLLSSHIPVLGLSVLEVIRMSVSFLFISLEELSGDFHMLQCLSSP